MEISPIYALPMPYYIIFRLAQLHNGNKKKERSILRLLWSYLIKLKLCLQRDCLHRTTMVHLCALKGILIMKLK